MLNTAAKLKMFFSGFGLPAYTTDGIPDEVELPYIAYTLVEPEWDEQASFRCQIYYPKRQLESLLRKADEVAGAIGLFKQIKMDGGYICLRPSTPYMQKMNDDYSESIMFLLSINAYHLPGQ